MQTLVFLVLLASLMAVRSLAMPRWISAQVELDDGTVRSLALNKPLIIDNQQSVTLDLSLRTTRLSSVTYSIKPKNCLESASIDGTPLAEEDIPFCHKNLTITSFNSRQSPTTERTATRHLRMKLTNEQTGVGVRILPIPQNLLWLHILFIALFLWYGSVLLRAIEPRFGLSPSLRYIVLGGVALRMFYFSFTPFFKRNYDTNGHIEYILYVLKHWMIPIAGRGWESHQQPLYYFLSAAWMHVAGLFGRPFHSQLNDLRLFSLLYSIGAFLLSLWIGKLLFRTTDEQRKLLTYAGLLAALPGLVFFSSRINNDTLALLLSFLIFGLLLHWWQQGTERHWYALCIAIGIGLLTKISLLPLLAIAGICLLFAHQHTIAQKIHMAAVSFLILGVLLGGTVAIRISQQPDTLLGSPMNPRLIVENSLSHFLTFRPSSIVARPFNNNWVDGSGRQFFWENFFKSIFFGEWNFSYEIGFFGSQIILAACLLILFLIAGGWHSIRRDPYGTLPVWLTALMLVASLILYRIMRPHSPNQDFRYIPLVAVPFAYYIAHGIAQPSSLVRLLGQLLVYILIALCTLFILLLAFYA